MINGANRKYLKFQQDRIENLHEQRRVIRFLVHHRNQRCHQQHPFDGEFIEFSRCLPSDFGPIEAGPREYEPVDVHSHALAQSAAGVASRVAKKACRRAGSC